MRSRDEALRSILAVRIPPDWDPTFHEYRPYERGVFRWPPGVTPGQGVEPTGQVLLAALCLRNEGLVDIHGGGCSVRAGLGETQAAFDHVLAWINR